MNKRKRPPFTIIETAIIDSDQLTWSEKRVYIALKSFRRNSPPTQCKPGQDKIMRRAGVDKKTYLKARDKLKIYGLIKFEPSRSEKTGAGPGRGKSINYDFPFEDGTEEEWKRLLAFLKVKKNGVKLHRFKKETTVKKVLTISALWKRLSTFLKVKKNGVKLHRFKTVSFDTVLRGKNGIDLHQKTVSFDTTNKKYLTRSNKEQQQGKEKKTVVASSSLNKKKEKPQPIVKENLNPMVRELATRVMKLGIKEDKALELVCSYPYNKIADQLDWLPYRKGIKNQAGALIKAVQEEWEEPAEYPKKTGLDEMVEKIKTQQAILRTAKEDLKKGVSYDRAKEWSDKLDPDYQKKFREFLKKEGYRGIAERLSWKESDKYKGVYE